MSTPGHVLLMPDGGVRHVAPLGAVADIMPPGPTPVTELSATEMLAVRGFLVRANDDLSRQLAAARAEGVGRQQYARMRTAANAIRSWLLVTVASLDADLKLDQLPLEEQCSDTSPQP